MRASGHRRGYFDSEWGWGPCQPPYILGVSSTPPRLAWTCTEMHSTDGGVSCLDVIKAVAALFFTDEVIFCLLVMYYTACTHSGNELETQVNPPHPFTPMLCDYFRRFWPSGDAHRRGLAHLASHPLRRRHRRLGDGDARGDPVSTLNAIEAWPWPTSD